MSSVPSEPTWHPDPEEEDGGSDSITFHEAPTVVENRHRKRKKLGAVALSSAGPAVSIAQAASGSAKTLAVAGAIVAGTAASATGIGLAAAAGAAMLTSSILSGRSAIKSVGHKKRLQDIYNDRDGLSGDSHCKWINEDGNEEATTYSRARHDQVANLVLPYAIFQKTKKTAYKAVGTVPVVGVLAPIYAVANKWGKAYRGELGKKRKKAAQALAEHLISCNCKLANKIVAELFDAGEAAMDGYRDMDYGKLREELELKLKST
jgi:hypothetical protein